MAPLPITIGFPVIGTQMPEPGDSPQQLVELLEQDPPHWIYHLRIRKAHRQRHDFSAVPPATVKELAKSLGLKGSFHLRPLEYLHGELPEPPACSPYAFGLDNFFPADSALLALAVGLVAAATERLVPETVLCSGCIPRINRTLRLGATAFLAQKVLLGLGQEPGYAIQRILDRLYDHGSTRDYLGEPEQRVRPGNVRLFLIPARTDDEPLAFGPSLVVESLPAAILAQLGQQSMEELRAAIARLADGGMLLVRVPTVWHALHLLGYCHAHPFPKRWSDLQSEPMQVVRLRPQAAAAAPSPPASPGLDVQQELAELEARLARPGARDIYTRLRTILAQACRLLRCKSGDLAIVSAESDWLRVVARHGRGSDNLPHFVPRDTGITGRVLRTARPALVEDTADDPDLQDALASTDRLRSRYGDERAQDYEAFLRQIRSCVKIPLQIGDEILGILCLHRDRPGKFNNNLIGAVEALANRAAQEVAAFLREERARQRRPAGEGLLTVEELVQRHAGSSHATARRALGRELAELAHQRSGAYRVTVALVSPGRTALVTIAGAADTDDLLAQLGSGVLALGEDSAARLALTSGQSYIIRDTTLPRAVFRPVPPVAVSHASILLRAGRQSLGVIGLDWNRPDGCEEGMQAMLDEMARRYAVALAAHTPSDLLHAIDECGRDLGRREEDGAYWRFLRLVATPIGAVDGDLLWLRPTTGRYHLIASLPHPERVEEERSCAPGEGVTGWVARHNHPARVADLRSTAELHALGTEPPVWQGKWYDGERDGTNFTYLAVPVVMGKHVFGVLRFTANGSAAAFGRYEQEIATDAAGRLAWWLVQREETLARRELLEAASEHLRARRADAPAALSSAETETALLERVAAALARWLHAERVWAWLLADNAFEALASLGSPETCAVEPPFPGALEQALNGRSYLRAPLSGSELAGSSVSAPDDLSYVAFRMRASGQTVALFLVAARSDPPVQETSLEQASALLDHVAEVILAGRRQVPAGEGS